MSDYFEGRKDFALEIFSKCINELGEKEKTAEQWRKERHFTISALRTLCKEFGDNDWSDDLYLPDIINKHLAPYLTKDEQSAN